MNLTRGQRVALMQILTTRSLGVHVRTDHCPVHAALLTVDAEGRLLDPAFITYEGAPDSPDGAVRHAVTVVGRGAEHQFSVNLSRVDYRASKLIIALEPHEGYIRDIPQGSGTVHDATGRECARYSFMGRDFGDERVIVTLELYLHNQEWRVRAVGQGWYGGMEALIRNYLP